MAARLLLSAAVLALTLHAAQAFSQAPTGSYRIAGHIVSANNGQTLPRATVKILEPKSYKPVASVVSGEDGAFAFTNLAAGPYVLEGSLPGYNPSRYDAHGGFSTAIVTGAGVDTESLTLKLTREAEISGRVTDESGDPVRRANITLYREVRDTGIAHIRTVNNAQTDDVGVYDIAHLAPGKYFLSAKVTPWYAVRPQIVNPDQRQNSNFGVVESVDPTLDVAYPETFYPDATDSSGASPITLNAGDQSERNLRLTPQAAVTITIPHLSGNNAQQQALSADLINRMADREQQAYLRTVQRPQLQLQRKVFDSFESVAAESRFYSNTLSIVGVPPGQYVMRQVDPQTGVSKSTSISLNDRNTQLELPSGGDTGNLKVSFKLSSGTTFPPQSSLILLDQSGKQAATQRINENGEAEFKSVDAGLYYFRIAARNKQYFVTAVLLDGKPLPAGLVKISAGATISVTGVASPVSTNLEGFARTDGKPAAGAMVLLLPADPSERARSSWRDQSDLDGSFHLTGIPPGRYNLFAIQDGWDLEWQRDEVLARYLPLATPITIPDTATPSLKLSTPLPAQPL